MTDLQRRMLGAARLDAATYAEIEQDIGALGQALTVVLLSAAAFAIASPGPLRVGRLLASGLLGLLGWVLWSVLIVIAARLVSGAEARPDLERFLRTLGFATTPGLVHIVGIIGPLRPLAFVVAQAWMIAAMVVAVRQVLGYASMARALGVCLIAWCAQILVVGALSAALLPVPSDGARSRAEVDEPASAGAVGVVEPSGVAPPVN